MSTGSNLDRALAPGRSRPSEPEKEDGREPFNLRIDGIKLEDGKLLLRTEGTERDLALSTLNATGRFENGRHFIDAELQAAGRVDEPASGPLTLQLRAHRNNGDWSGNVRLQAAGAQVVAGASHGPHMRVQLSELVLPPDVTQLVLSWWPLVTDVRGQARLVREYQEVEVEADFDAASASVALQGDFDSSMRGPPVGFVWRFAT